MNNNVIKPGDKVEIRIIQRVEQGKRLGENPPAYYSMVEDEDEDGLSQTTLQPNNKESLVSPTHPIQW